MRTLPHFLTDLCGLLLLLPTRTGRLHAMSCGCSFRVLRTRASTRPGWARWREVVRRCVREVTCTMDGCSRVIFHLHLHCHKSKPRVDGCQLLGAELIGHTLQIRLLDWDVLPRRILAQRTVMTALMICNRMERLLCYFAIFRGLFETSGLREGAAESRHSKTRGRRTRRWWRVTSAVGGVGREEGRRRRKKG